MPVTRDQAGVLSHVLKRELKDNPNSALLGILVKDYVKAHQLGIFDILNAQLQFSGWRLTGQTWILSSNPYDQKRYEAPGLLQAAAIQMKLEEGRLGEEGSEVPFSSVLSPGRVSGSLSISPRPMRND